jgi:Cu/Ag efflux protein CusF
LTPGRARIAGVVIAIDLAIGAAILGHLWWPGGAERAARATADADPTEWRVRGIVRGAIADREMLVLTHEEVPGLMGAMTMGFRVVQPAWLGLAAGDRVTFTLVREGGDYLIAGLVTDGERTRPR